ncbi:MFS transporter [Legionella sp. WA2022007384]
MKTTIQLPFTTLVLMISFASVNAVLFSPALPNIAEFFSISDITAQQTISWFLIGYALGQLVYGPIANRFGRKPALYIGISLQITSSLLCVLAGTMHYYPLLVLGRFLLALGAGVGLKMTFTLVNECYAPKEASQKISYLLLAFAITPGLGVALGGILNSHFGWMSCFFASAFYGLILLLLVGRLPETQKNLNYDSLKPSYLLSAYGKQFKNSQLIAGGLLMGACTSFIYAFAAIAPFIAINAFGMSSTEYGIANILPSIGLILGSLIGAKLTNKHTLQSIMFMGLCITLVGVLAMFLCLCAKMPIMFSLFIPTITIYLGLCFILANASSIAMSGSDDKAHASAVMNFINMGTATVIVLCMGIFTLNTFLLPAIYILLSVFMMGMYKWLMLSKSDAEGLTS